MTRTYFDTSALRHALVDTPHNHQVRTTIDRADAVALTSAVTVTELLRVGTRYPELVAAHVEDLLARLSLVPVTLDQLRAAGLLPDVPAGTPLRSLDAIHIQAALDTEATIFLTSDVRQSRAAAALGLRTEVLA